MILWGSASGLVVMDGLSLSQRVHSREMTAGIHVMKEPGCFSLSAVRREPWILSPGGFERNTKMSPSFELATPSLKRYATAAGDRAGEKCWAPLLPAMSVWSLSGALLSYHPRQAVGWSLTVHRSNLLALDFTVPSFKKKFFLICIF